MSLRLHFNRKSMWVFLSTKLICSPLNYKIIGDFRENVFPSKISYICQKTRLSTSRFDSKIRQAVKDELGSQADTWL